VALLWTVHPLQTECVNYVTQRSESLMALFYLLTLYCAIRAEAGRRALAWQAASVVACALGMAAKESMVTAPLMVALYDWAYRAEPWRSVLQRRVGLYAGLAATWGVLAWLVAGGPRAATVGLGLDTSASDYLLNQLVAVTTYLRLIVWPDPLVLDYGFPGDLTIRDVLPQLILVAGVVAGAAVLLARRPPAGYPVVWLLVTLAPTSSVVPIVTEVAAERRMYLPLAGAIAILVAAAWLLAARGPAGRWASRRRAAAVAVLVGVVGPLVGVTWRRNALYRDPVALWQATVAAVPGNHRAHTNLGAALVAERRLDEAIERFELALRIKPRTAQTGYNLANALAATDRVDEAAAMAREALAWAEASGDEALASDIRARLALYEAGRVE
jgi:tetratricopeptide (TPR) repeat protein